MANPDALQSLGPVAPCVPFWTKLEWIFRSEIRRVFAGALINTIVPEHTTREPPAGVKGVQTGDRRDPVLCLCRQVGQDSPKSFQLCIPGRPMPCRLESQVTHLKKIRKKLAKQVRALQKKV